MSKRLMQTNTMIRFKQISKLLAAIICLVICNSVHGQSVGFNAYELKIDGDTNGPTFDYLINPLTEIELQIFQCE